jgi:S-formylglutathione hydrolase FrmB
MYVLRQTGVGFLALIISLSAEIPAQAAIAGTSPSPQPAITQAPPQRRAPAESFPNAGVQYGTVPSEALGKDLKFAIQLPPSYERDSKRRFPVLYFLHGMFGNEGEFEHRGIAATVARFRDEGKVGDFIIVAPAGENSFYLNSKNGVRYEDAIIKDLIPYIEKNYRAMGTREGRAIQGISMGGWGALMLALKYPNMFSSVTTHCAALYAQLPALTGDDRRTQFMLRLIGNIFGQPPDEEFFRSVNPFYIAERNAAAVKKSGLKIYFDCGDRDRFGYNQSNQAFDQKLTQLGIAHEFHLFPGDHGWEYMRSVADHSYAFLWQGFSGAVDKSGPVRSSTSHE